MPSTRAAIAVFESNGVIFGPSKAANAGGVAVAGLEMAQNAAMTAYSRDDVDARLQAIMAHIQRKRARTRCSTARRTCARRME